MCDHLCDTEDGIFDSESFTKDLLPQVCVRPHAIATQKIRDILTCHDGKTAYKASYVYYLLMLKLEVTREGALGLV
jgi:hypothetical protein